MFAVEFSAARRFKEIRVAKEYVKRLRIHHQRPRIFSDGHQHRITIQAAILFFGMKNKITTHTFFQNEPLNSIPYFLIPKPK